MTYVSIVSPRAPGPGRADRVGDLDDRRLDAGELDLLVVGGDAFTTFIGMLCFCAIAAPMAACGPSTSWSTALPMSCSRPPILAALDVRAELGRDDRGEVARLDAVDEHVLAVARAVLEPAEELDELGREARDAGLVGGLLAGLADDEVDLGAWPC